MVGQQQFGHCHLRNPYEPKVKSPIVVCCIKHVGTTEDRLKQMGEWSKPTRIRPKYAGVATRFSGTENDA